MQNKLNAENKFILSFIATILVVSSIGVMFLPNNLHANDCVDSVVWTKSKTKEKTLEANGFKIVLNVNNQQVKETIALFRENFEYKDKFLIFSPEDHLMLSTESLTLAKAYANRYICDRKEFE